jgi:2-keto-3-deoxy-L-rhamnonate aldolase RhmA
MDPLAVGINDRGGSAEAAVVSREFELFLFSTDPTSVPVAIAAGVSGVVVDWERVGKRHRQTGADTQIGEDTIDDLRRVRACISKRIICRIDNNVDLLDEQIEAAVDGGADEILLPMVRSAVEVEEVIARAGGRCGVGILIETQAAIAELDDIGTFQLARAYMGLNDLAIDRGSTNIFEPLVDGTVEFVRNHLSIPFGFAGLTVADAGAPIPCRLLIAELIRLDCSFSFLRRSYHADIRRRDPAREIPRLRAALDDATRRTAAEVAEDRDALIDAVDDWAGVLASA